MLLVTFTTTIGRAEVTRTSSMNGAEVCLRILQQTAESPSPHKSFWKNRTNATVATKNGKQPFAFGFDAELWKVQDIIRLATLDPEGFEAAEATLRKKKLEYSLEQLKPWLGLPVTASNREVRKHLRPGVTAPYTLLDLKPKSLRGIQHDYRKKKPYSRALRRVMQATFDRKGLPIKVGWEGSSGSQTQGVLGGGETIELEMVGSTSKPAEFQKLIKQVLYKNADGPETHFHLSIPNDSSSPHQVMMAARAMEMKITLEEAIAELEYDGSMAPYDASTFGRPAARNLPHALSGRGAVRISGGRWQKPVPAADVEFRQWLDEDHALENMRFMMKLIENADRLRNTSRFKGTRIGGLSPSNLHNSLEYAALLLEERLPRNQQNIVVGLRAFAKEIKARRQVTPEMRKKVAQFLRDTNVLSYITLETFLNE